MWRANLFCLQYWPSNLSCLQYWQIKLTLLTILTNQTYAPCSIDHHIYVVYTIDTFNYVVYVWTTFYRWTLLMSVYKYAVGLMNTRQTNTRLHPHWWNRYSDCIIYYKLYIVLSSLFCLRYSVTFICIHIFFYNLKIPKGSSETVNQAYLMTLNIPWLSLGIYPWIQNSCDSNDYRLISQQEQHDWCHYWSRNSLPFRSSHRLLVMLNL